jgi:metallophosphoesterase (TIGR03767 family)
MAGLTRRRLLTAAGTASLAYGVLPEQILRATRTESLHVAPAAADSTSATTLDQTIRHGSVLSGNYRSLITGPGEPHLPRLDVLRRAPSTDRSVSRRSVAYIGHLSDLHVIDSQSPGRIEPLIAADHSAWASAFHPQDAVSPHTVAAMVSAFGDMRTSRLTGAPMTAAVVTGDSADMHSSLELRWYIDLLDGTMIDPATSGPSYQGVQAWSEATWAYRPGDPRGGAFGEYGFPRLPHLLEQAVGATIHSPGLPAPWYAVPGNHDTLLLGTFRPTPTFEALAVGGRKAASAEATAIIGLGGYASSGSVLQQAVSALRLAIGGGTRPVPSNEERAVFLGNDFVRAHLRSTEGPGPVGHGFTPHHLESGETWWSADVNPRVRLLGLDTCNAVAGPDGAVPEVQLRWLEGELRRAEAQQRLVVVLSHHNSTTLENRAQRPGDGTRLHGADDLLDLLLRSRTAIAWLNGHTHVNQILPHTRGARGLWEITTASCIDYPQQQQVIEIVDNRDGTLSLFTTVVDHASPVSSGGTGSVPDLAARSRELAANDWIAQPLIRAGSLLDRNTELLLPAPFPLEEWSDADLEGDRLIAHARIAAWEQRRTRGGA